LYTVPIYQCFILCFSKSTPLRAGRSKAAATVESLNNESPASINFATINSASINSAASEMSAIGETLANNSSRRRNPPPIATSKSVASRRSLSTGTDSNKESEPVGKLNKVGKSAKSAAAGRSNKQVDGKEKEATTANGTVSKAAVTPAIKATAAKRRLPNPEKKDEGESPPKKAGPPSVSTASEVDEVRKMQFYFYRTATAEF
jgi:hypothetical protein